MYRYRDRAIIVQGLMRVKYVAIISMLFHLDRVLPGVKFQGA